jgi:hypothetical protein
MRLDTASTWRTQASRGIPARMTRSSASTWNGGKTYTVTASGEAFMSSQTGVDADPFPGVFVLYGTDEADCYATRQIVLAPRKSITFRSPWLIDPASDVSLLAFFLDVWPDSPNRGSYKLTVTQASKEDASKVPPGTLQTP